MDTQVEALAWKLRRRQVTGSRETALETVLLLRNYIAKAKFSSIEQLVQRVKEAGKKLIDAQPFEHTVGNTVRKVLHHIREEYNTAAQQAGKVNESYSLSTFVIMGHPRVQARGLALTPSSMSRTSSSAELDRQSNIAEGFRPVLLDAIQDVIDELETVYDNVSKNAKEHIHSDEIILTVGNSKTVESFLKTAHHSRNFSVIVAETAPTYSGRKMAKSLSNAGISTFLVPDSAVYALMARVTKVLLGAHAVLADGGMFAVTGSLLAATAARVHSTPVVVCTGQYKFTPIWNVVHEYGAMDYADPNHVLGFDQGDLVSKVQVLNPNWDYVKTSLIDVYITNDGDHPPSSVYRLIKEAYDDKDHEL